jgi:glutamate N-acetyltransferase/amino-acid N-acetyltransferase
VTVTTPAGFRAAGVTAGLKPSGKPDLALVVNDGTLDAAAAVFTTNRIEAAPVTWSRQAVSDGRLRAVVLNSGGANACTGPEGFADTHATAEHVAAVLGLSASDIGVCSTGLIGLRLPMDKLLAGIDVAAKALAGDGGPAAANAIRTTDTVAKTTAITSPAGWSVGGMAKGAGMLAPALATMLVVLTTDAVVDAVALDKALREACRLTFARVDSDGCLSTNDTVILMASGASGLSPSYADLATGVHTACLDLAQQLLADAEGAGHDIRVDVVGAATEDDALLVARAVARSNLLKCAIHGRDANWGRVLAAAGTTDAVFDPHAIDVAMNGVWVCKAAGVGESRDGVDLSGRDVAITVDLHAGEASAWIWTNDLTEAYVHENSAYST